MRNNYIGYGSPKTPGKAKSVDRNKYFSDSPANITCGFSLTLFKMIFN